jgi:hypothetical protein
MQNNINLSNKFYIKTIKFIIIIHFFSLLLHGQLSYVNNHVHIDFSKFIFLAIFIIFFLLVIKKKIQLYFSYKDFFFITLILISLFQFYFLEKIEFFLSLLINFYIFFIYLFYKNLILNNYKFYLIKLIKTVTIVASLIGIIGWIISQLGISNYFVLNYQYPLALFKSVRAKSLFNHPTYFFIFQIIGLFLYLKLFLKKKKIKNLYLIIIIFLGMVVTFSKSILLLFSVFLLFIYSNAKINNIKKYLLKFFIFSSILFYLLFSHLIFINKNSKNYDYYTSKVWVVEKNTVIKFKDYEIYLNNYFSLKKISLEIFLNRPVFGSGELSLKKYNKLFDNPSNNHHSQYMNILANKGIIGFAIYLILLLVTIRDSLRNKNNKLEFYFIFYLIFESFFSDLNSFNFLWFAIASVEAQRIKDI